MSTKKLKCYCNICKRRRELGLDPAHVIAVDDLGKEKVIPVAERRRKRRHARRPT